ncbi:MAG TPA: metal/formaldehyde-sensitive transcriptional repressor [Rhodanobacter sp.]|nr:metal/formaldehyde-sensitive transcriptional repressor [Rhodanobacter sp.]
MSHVKHDRKLLARVRRIGGQVASLERALGSDADCGAVLQQLAAVRGAVNGLIMEVMEGHLRHHLETDGAAREKGLAPVLAVLRSYLR